MNVNTIGGCIPSWRELGLQGQSTVVLSSLNRSVISSLISKGQNTKERQR